MPMMYVNVKPDQFALVHRTMAQGGLGRDPELRDDLCRWLTVWSTENGGNFDETLARAGSNTELRLMDRICRYCRDPVKPNTPCACDRAQEEYRRIMGDRR